MATHTGSTPHLVEDSSIGTHTGSTPHWGEDSSIGTHTGSTPHWVEDSSIGTHTGSTPHWVGVSSMGTHTGLRIALWRHTLDHGHHNYHLFLVLVCLTHTTCLYAGLHQSR